MTLPKLPFHLHHTAQPAKEDWVFYKPTIAVKETITNFIWSYLHQFFDDSHGLKASLKPLRRPFDRYQSHLEAINNG